MNFDPNLDLVVRNFTANFNQMCRGSHRDYVIRAQNSKGETNQKPKTYPVEYKMRFTEHSWEVFAEWRKWYIFSKKFPFIEIYETGKGKLKLSGLFTENMPVINKDPQELQQLLQKYLEHCRSLPAQSFVNV